MEVDRGDEVLLVPKAPRRVFHPLDLGVAPVMCSFRAIRELRMPCPQVLGIDEHFFTRRHGPGGDLSL